MHALAEMPGHREPDLLRIGLFVQLARMAAAVAAWLPTGTRVSRPTGGFVLWVELPRTVCSRELLLQALAENICFAPGEVFAASKRYTHCLRLSCGHGWDTRIEAGVRRLGELACAAAASETEISDANPRTAVRRRRS